MTRTTQTEVLVIGSGAGGAVTALTLAGRGHDVLVLEEGRRFGIQDYGKPPTKAMQLLFRQSGMTPIMGRTPIGYVEGCCVGGSTEINSGFWQRTPPEILLRWKAQFDLAQAGADDLAPHFTWAEQLVGVTTFQREWPASTQAFARGITNMGWSYQEVPRAAPGCQNSNACAHGCPTGAKQGMSRRVLPEAEAAGARILPGCRVDLLLKRNRRVLGVVATLQGEDGREQLIRIDAEHVIVCCGPTETPVLLLRSGVRYHVGNTLRIHPYLKVAARFQEEMHSEHSVLPLLQVKEFWPEISFGGSFFTRGLLAMTLSENWPQTQTLMPYHNRMAIYYVGVMGTGKGRVRPSLLGHASKLLHYDLSDEDCRNLSKGLARLAALLLAAGAEEVYPSVYGLPVIRTELEAIRWLDEPLRRSNLGLTAVHAFSSCPIGERRERCAADSFGRVYGYENLYVNDASMLPDSPGVSPQGSIMALARRNALHFAETRS